MGVVEEKLAKGRAGSSFCFMTTVTLGRPFCL
jgi:hypothetical protein